MLNPQQMRDKYRQRERESVLQKILLQMEEFGITFQELEAYSEKTEIHLRDQILSLRKKANVRRELDGRRRKEAEANRQTQRKLGKEVENAS